MLKHLYILLVATFVMGVLSGIFVFFISRPATSPTGPIKEEVGIFEIIVDTYGGCSNIGCSSLRILENGEYILVENNRLKGSNRFEGKLNLDEVRNLTRQLGQINFSKLMSSKFQGTCPIAYDGIAYRYLITYGEKYTIDSCTQNVEGVDLFERLDKYFTDLRSNVDQ